MNMFSFFIHNNFMRISMKNNLKNALIGISVGIISGLFTSGGGLLLIPIFSHFLNLPEKQSRATTVFCILPMVIATAFFYQSNNFIDWKVGIQCAIGGIIGGFIGAKLLNILKPKYLKIIFAFFLLYAGTKIAFF